MASEPQVFNVFLWPRCQLEVSPRKVWYLFYVIQSESYCQWSKTTTGIIVRKRNNTWIWLFRTEDLRAPSESNCLILSATRLLVFFYFYWFRGRYHFDEMSYSRRFWFQEGKRFDFWMLEMITQIPHCDNSPSYDSCNIDFSIIIEDAIMQEERFHNYGDSRLFIDFIRLKL